VYLKCEHLQETGSVKLRGALNKLSLLSPEQRSHGVYTSSTGNHGMAVAAGLHKVGGRGTVVVSASASRYKLERLARAGLEVITVDAGPLTAELEARARAEREGAVYISPYNDTDVAAGQGTIAVELLVQRPSIRTVYVAVGGGGLIAGIASYLAVAAPHVTVVGCWPERAAAMYEAIRAGHLVEVPDEPTLSDATAGNIEPGSVTFAFCRDLVREHVLVTEDEIASAMRDIMLDEHMVVEGAAAVTLAAWRAMHRSRPDIADAETALVLCGGNVSAPTLAKVLSV
jgi:threonine dehydratase